MLVWAGNDDNTPIKSSESKKTKKIWSKTISSLPKSNNSWYEIPDAVTASVIDPISGELSIYGKGYLCYYEKGTEPNYIYNNDY